MFRFLKDKSACYSAITGRLERIYSILLTKKQPAPEISGPMGNVDETRFQHAPPEKTPKPHSISPTIYSTMRPKRRTTNNQNSRSQNSEQPSKPSTITHRLTLPIPKHIPNWLKRPRPNEKVPKTKRNQNYRSILALRRQTTTQSTNAAVAKQPGAKQKRGQTCEKEQGAYGASGKKHLDLRGGKSKNISSPFAWVPAAHYDCR